MVDATRPSAKLGAVTVGQSPRPDLMPLLQAALPNGAELLECGVLDGLSRQEIERDFSPEPGEPTLISRLVDGKSVVIAKPHAEARLPLIVERLERAGCETVLLLCTGAFRGLDDGHARVLQPHDLLIPTVQALAKGRRVGLMVAVKAQIDAVPVKWACLSAAEGGRAPLVQTVSPYDAADDEIAETAAMLAKEGAEILFCDCIGYGEHHRQVARQASGLPVIVATSLLSKLVSELV